MLARPRHRPSGRFPGPSFRVRVRVRVRVSIGASVSVKVRVRVTGHAAQVPAELGPGLVRVR